MTTRSRRVATVTASVFTAVALTACSATSTGSGAPTTSGAAAPATDANVAGDIPDNQAFVPYTPPDGGFTVNVPEGWAQASTSAGVSFSDKYNQVEITSSTSSTAPTVDSVTQTELPGLRASTPGFGNPTVSVVARKVGQGVLLTYAADSAPNSVTGKVAREAVERYEFWRAGTTVALTLSAPEGSDNVDPWRAITDSLHWAP